MKNLQSLLGELTALPRVLWLMRRRAVMLLMMTNDDNDIGGLSDCFVVKMAYDIILLLSTCCIFQTAG